MTRLFTFSSRLLLSCMLAAALLALALVAVARVLWVNDENDRAQTVTEDERIVG
jgi:hypothetical protein